MSGIAGIRAFDHATIGPRDVEAMAERLEHRGPDEMHSWIGPGIGLSHARLAITDVEESHQPMHSCDGRWVLAFDGEIYNHDSLRSHLDYPFRTRGDTEVVLAGLALEGISFVERLHGQFAFVAHDLLTQSTHLVRDRLGVLPLYYRHIPSGLAFASEVKALLAVGPAPQVDPRSLDSYLATQSVPAPDTLFEGVKKLRPAHRISMTPGGHLEETSYWTPPESDPEGTWCAGDAIEAVADGVRESVRAALDSDVPVGADLSGGLASSLVVAQMQQLLGEDPVHTFSTSFGPSKGATASGAHHVAELLGTQHHQVHVRATDFEDLWSTLTWHRDAPVSEPSDIAAFATAHAAREQVGVVLSGEGGEEIFGDHRTTRLTRFAEHSALVPQRLRSRIAAPSPRQPHGPFTPAECAQLLGRAAPVARPALTLLGTDAFDRSMREDVRHWLPDHLLERGDRLSMAASVAWRPALLEHRLVELAFRLPSSVKVRSGSARWLLEEVARPIVPPEVLSRRAVVPRVPLNAWFRTDLRDTAHDWLSGPDSWVGRTLDRATVRAVIERHERGANQEARLFALLGLEMWHRCFFAPTAVVPRPRQASRPVVGPAQRV